MDLGQGRSITRLGNSMESHGRSNSKNAFRRFQKFLVRKRFKMPGRSRRLHRTGGIGLLRASVLGAYARDELGISEKFRARPLQASLAATCSFALGAMMPLMVTAIAPQARLIPFVSPSSLAVLALMGGLAARAGGARVMMGAIRVTFCGGLAMAMTAGIGWLVGAIA
jgi:VIT1/CCC1 family predicted Fe2+/Mn2+ transporter